MTQHRIAVTPDFAEHLRLLGLSGVTPGVHMIDAASEVETPVSLCGADIWRDRVSIGAFSYCGARTILANVSVGRYCSIAEGVQVGMTQHPAGWLSTSPISYVPGFMNFEAHFADADPAWHRELPLQPYDLRPATTIGNDVWIGGEAYLRDGITVGDGAIIGTRSVVTRDVPPYAIVAGSPARILRYRFPDSVIERMLAVAWWRFNILDFGNFNVSAPEACLIQLEEAIAEDWIAPYAPDPISLVAEHGRFQAIQRMLRAA